jgi:hypothetical protein
VGREDEEAVAVVVCACVDVAESGAAVVDVVVDDVDAAVVDVAGVVVVPV